jgi:hypothetical protein
MSATLAAKNGYRLDWTGTWELQTDTPFYSPDDPAPLTVLISFELPAPIRVERLLTLGLGLSRAEVRRMVADGRIRLSPALDAKAHQDFELTVDGGRSPAKSGECGQRACHRRGNRTAPTPGMAWACASASRAAAACWPFSPVRDIRAAIRPVTTGVEKDVPLHLARP